MQKYISINSALALPKDKNVPQIFFQAFLVIFHKEFSSKRWERDILCVNVGFPFALCAFKIPFFFWEHYVIS